MLTNAMEKPDEKQLKNCLDSVMEIKMGKSNLKHISRNGIKCQM